MRLPFFICFFRTTFFELFLSHYVKKILSDQYVIPSGRFVPAGKPATGDDESWRRF
tara:strand:- start:84 stop:251 length:168 start_codon:yes stop_codon:yes gene_type:complete